jgi:hypothetical protein
VSGSRSTDLRKEVVSMSLKPPKVFEVSVTYLVCTDTKEHAKEYVLRQRLNDWLYQQVKTRELKSAVGVPDEDTMHLHHDQDERDEDIPF